MIEENNIYYDKTNSVLFEKREPRRIKLRIRRRDVLAAYLTAKRRKSSTSSHLEFYSELFKNLYLLWKDLISGNYEISKSNCFIVTRPKPREVFAASFRDRVVHHLIVGKLMPYFEKKFIANSFSCMPGKGTLFGIKKLHESLKRHPKGKVYKYDISSFFMSISKQLLSQKVDLFIKKNYLGSKEEKKYLRVLSNQIILHHPEENCCIHGNVLLWNLIEYSKSLFTVDKDRGLPIGNLTSQLFAGVYLMELDNFLNKQFGDDYGRYVDDFYIVSEDEEKVKQLIPQIEKLLSDKLRLTLHPNKRYSQPVHHGCKFLGCVVKGNRVYVGNNTVNNFLMIIEHYNLEDKITIQSLMDCFRSLNSYLGYFSYCNAFKILRRILLKLDKKWYPYFKTKMGNIRETENKEGKKLKICVQFKSRYKLLNFLNL